MIKTLIDEGTKVLASQPTGDIYSSLNKLDLANPDNQRVRSDSFVGWQTKCLVAIGTRSGERSTYYRQFERNCKQPTRGDVLAGLQILKAIAVESSANQGDALSDELRRLVISAAHFVIHDQSFSPYNLIPRICHQKGVLTERDLTGKCMVLTHHYWGYRNLLSDDRALTKERLVLYIDEFHTVIRSIESCLKDLLDHLSWEGELRDQEREDYRRLEVNYNAFVTEWESYLRKADKQSIGFMLLPALNEIKQRSRAPEGESVFPAGGAYDAYKLIKQLLGSVIGKAIIVEPYPSEEFFGLFLEAIPRGVDTRVLVKRCDAKFLAIATRYRADPKVRLEIRQVAEIHDRVLILDERCWVIGQSLKDAAMKSPTYLVEMESALQMSRIYDGIWNDANTLL